MARNKQTVAVDYLSEELHALVTTYHAKGDFDSFQKLHVPGAKPAFTGKVLRPIGAMIQDAKKENDPAKRWDRLMANLDRAMDIDNGVRTSIDKQFYRWIDKSRVLG